MRVYKKTKENTLQTVYCNKCGQELKVKSDRVEEGVCTITTDWGYFSKKDGQIHTFDLCEACYDQMVKEFNIPIEIMDKLEVM